MTTRLTAHRLAAVLTAAVVAVSLVAFGGASRGTGQVGAAGPSHASSTVKPGRLPHAVAPSHHQQAPQHLDLTATPPAPTADVRETASSAAPGTAVVRAGRDLVTPIGRAPPAL